MPRHDLARRASSWMGWAALVLGLLPMLVAVVGKGFGLEKPSWWGDAFLGTTWATAIAAAIGAAMMATIATRTAGTLRVDGSDLVITRGQRERRVPIAAVTGAMVRPTPGGRGSVELVLAEGESILADVTDTATARTLLSEAGIDVRRRTSRVTIAPSMRWAALTAGLVASFIAGPLLLPVGRESIAGAAMWLALVGAAFVAAMVATAAPDVTVGLDGIRITTLRGARFISFDGVVAAWPTRTGFELAGPAGAVRIVELFHVSTPRRVAQRNAILESVREALDARASEAGAASLSALARGGRPVAAWREAIGHLVRDAGYRAPGVSFDETLSRADASAEDRIGAALALSASQPQVAAERIRIAAETCADPKVRIALERVAEGAEVDAAIEDALAASTALLAERAAR